MESINFITIFTTGLLVGGLTCMAVQGGLLAATIAQREEERLKERAKRSGNALPIIAFLIAKLVAYSALGFFLGWVGSFFELSIATQVILQVIVALFMIATALNLLDVHPIFRYVVIQPPKFITRRIRSVSKSNDAVPYGRQVFAPALLGALTIFIPCGTTQAMMALAVATGNPMIGALVLFLFTLGTSPVFFILGYLATRLSGVFHQRFMKVAAYAIILLALFNLNNALALTGGGIELPQVFGTEEAAIASEAETEATITIEQTGYQVSVDALKAGEQITLKLVNKDALSCAQAFTIPSLGIQEIIPPGVEKTISFTAPTKPGKLQYMCSMGMYEGSFQII